MFQPHVVKKGTVFGATLLVSGTCIGGGMLALPVITAPAGFFPSLVLMGACWVFMTLTGLLLIEANLWMEEGAHITTMASRLLGRFGKVCSSHVVPFYGICFFNCL
jgi:tyrosine-specific transport protein